MTAKHSLLVVVLTAAAGCGKDGSTAAAAAPAPAAQTAKPDFTVTTAELRKEFEAGEEAYKAKYAGKVVELTGTVYKPVLQTPTFGALNLDYEPKAKNYSAQLINVTPVKADAAKFEALQALSKGQKITVRGTVQKYGISLEDCAIVSVGPSTALPVTPSGLLAALKTPAGMEKYHDKDVVLKGVLKTSKIDGRIVKLEVADSAAAAGPFLEVSRNFNSKEDAVAAAKTPAGTELIVLGEAQNANDGRVWDFRILKAPPEGVALPAAEKK